MFQNGDGKKVSLSYVSLKNATFTNEEFLALVDNCCLQETDVHMWVEHVNDKRKARDTEGSYKKAAIYAREKVTYVQFYDDVFSYLFMDINKSCARNKAKH